MTKFIQLSKYDGYRVGEKIRISVDQISHYEGATRDAGSYITMKNGQERRVSETPEMIDRMIADAEKESK